MCVGRLVLFTLLLVALLTISVVILMFLAQVISNEVVAYRDRSTEVERNEQTRFEAVAEISERDAYLLAYLFSKKVSADDSFGR